MKLKPCPFCGAEPRGPEAYNNYVGPNQEWWIECDNCSVVLDGLNKDDLISRWNTRPPEK